MSSSTNQKPQKIVVIGGVAAGAGAAAKSRRLNEQAEIILFERSAHISVGVCGFPYLFSGVIPEKEKLLVLKTQTFKSWFNIDVRSSSEVSKIDRENKSITVTDLKTQKTYQESYDKLVIATGAKPFIPPIPGTDLEGIHALRSYENLGQIEDRLRQSPKHCLIVGAGAVGLELAENLHKRIPALTVVEAQSQLVPFLDPEMTTSLETLLKEKGVELRLAQKICKIEKGSSMRLRAIYEDNSTQETDMILFATGQRPESAIARECGLALTKGGYIAVNSHMQTSDESIYAAGAVVEIQDLILKENFPNGLAGVAQREGRVAAYHINGRGEASFNGSQGTNFLRIFGLSLASTGVNEKALKKAKFTYTKLYIHRPNHPSYFPESSPIHLKLLFHPSTGQIYGASAVGIEGVDKRIDSISIVIQMRGTVFDLENLELCYAPMVNSPRDPDNYLGTVGANIIRGDLQQAFPDQLQDIPDLQLVDVREPGEVEKSGLLRVGGAVAKNIPIGEIRNRFLELDKTKSTVLYCGVGMRSYLSSLVLKQNGFTKVFNLSGGFTTATCFKLQTTKSQ